MGACSKGSGRPGLVLKLRLSFFSHVPTLFLNFRGLPCKSVGAAQTQGQFQVHPKASSTSGSSDVCNKRPTASVNTTRSQSLHPQPNSPASAQCPPNQFRPRRDLHPTNSPSDVVSAVCVCVVRGLRTMCTTSDGEVLRVEKEAAGWGTQSIWHYWLHVQQGPMSMSRWCARGIHVEGYSERLSFLSVPPKTTETGEVHLSSSAVVVPHRVFRASSHLAQSNVDSISAKLLHISGSEQVQRRLAIHPGIST